MEVTKTQPTVFRYVHGLLLSLLIVLTAQVEKGVSQRIGIAHQDYMKAIGWEDDFIVMNNILKNELMNRVENKPPAYYTDNASFFSMVLLLSGVRPIYYYKLQENGVDVVHGITANIRPFDEQALLSDLAVLGEVVDVISESFNDDGFDITVKVQISEVLKGETPVDTILIRQRASSRRSGNDNSPELGRTYLLLLSSGMYGYHKANYQMREEKEIVVSPPDFGEEEIFVIYRIYPYVNDQLQRSHQNRNAAFRSLRRVDSLLKGEV